MVNSSEKFLIDANTLMTASRFFYAYDLVPSFWEAFEDEIKAGNIVLLDMVKAEIDKGQDELSVQTGGIVAYETLLLFQYVK